MKKISIFLLCNLLLILFFVSTSFNVYAHETTLDVEYDDCLPEDYVNSSNIGDGYNEKWYELVKGNDAWHIPHSGTDVTEIRYYISPVGETSTTINWSTGIDDELSDRIINDFTESLEKWNNVWYYTINSEGLYEKKKLVNVVAGTEDNHNLIIYPKTSGSVASTWPTSSRINAQSVNSITHGHYNEWAMEVNISEMASMSLAELDNILSRTGAHEIGHVLGLRDIDSIENSSSSNYHHEEILMGYSEYSNYITRQSNITYRDIAGVAITRGFHTDSDHLWLYDKDNPKDGKYKLICSLCNCVKYVDDLSSYNYYEYKQCGHSESSLSHTVDDNMIPVASYGNTDYYKCKYCRYVAPFTSRITQNYVYCGEHDDSKHILENSSGNLNYKISENHSLTVNLGGNNYKCSGCDYRTINTFEEFSLSNYSSTINKAVNLSSNETKYYKINSNYNKYYEFIVDGTHGVDIKLFDENFNEILVNDLNDSNAIEHFINQLQVGTYYLEIKNSSSSTNSASIKIVSRTTAYIGVGDNDVLLNTHNYNEGIYPTNYYYYVNDNGVGFYRFTLTGVKIDGTTVTYPYSSIMIKDHMNENIIDKFSLTGYNNQAISGYNENTFIAYLNTTGYFYVYIDIDTEGLETLTLNIEPVDTDTLNLFDLSESISEEVEIFDENIKGDYFERLDLKQAGKFEIEITYDGLSTNDILFVLAKRIYNSSTNTYSLQTKCIGLLNDTNDTYSSTKNLEDGTYYIGYFNKNDNSNITVTFNRLITQYGSQYLVADPDIYSLHGSETRFNNGAYQGNRLTIGFTRFLFINNTLDIPSQYTQDYYLYSSNESVATISQYGTILGLSPGTTKIMAVYKNNPSIVYVKEFTVVDEVREDDLVIINTDNIGYAESGQLYSISLTDTNSFFPQLSLYNWSVVNSENNYHYSISMWGTFRMNGTDVITIEGRSTINSKLVIRLVLTVN